MDELIRASQEIIPDREIIRFSLPFQCKRTIYGGASDLFDYDIDD